MDLDQRPTGDFRKHEYKRNKLFVVKLSFVSRGNRQIEAFFYLTPKAPEERL